MNGQLRDHRKEGAGPGNSGSSPGERQQVRTGWRRDEMMRAQQGCLSGQGERGGRGALGECLRGSDESESRSVVSDSLQPHGLHSLRNSPGQNTAVGSLSLLPGIFPTQGSKPDFLHCRQILYQLSQKRIQRILEWVAYPFLSGFSQPSN